LESVLVQNRFGALERNEEDEVGQKEGSKDTNIDGEDKGQWSIVVNKKNRWLKRKNKEIKNKEKDLKNKEYI